MTDYKLINEVLANLDEYSLGKRYAVVAEEKDRDFGTELDQGETSKKHIVFKLPMDDLYLKVTVISDSYGDREWVSSVQFTRPVIKTVQEFIPL